MLILLCTGCAEFKGIFDEGAHSSRDINTLKPGSSAGRQARVEPGTSAEGRDPITTKEGIYYFVREGDSLAKISQHYRIDWEAIAQINALFDHQLVVGRRLFIPHKRNLEKFGVVPRTIAATQKHKSMVSGLTSRLGPKGKLSFVWPVSEGRISSYFGSRWGRPHDAIDIACKIGTPVYAAESGKIIFAKRFAGYGNLIVVKHRDNYFTAYAHNNNILVHNGQKVKRSQQIGVVGRTGHATGPHLHFEVHKGTEAVDPLQFFPDKAGPH